MVDLNIRLSWSNGALSPGPFTPDRSPVPHRVSSRVVVSFPRALEKRTHAAGIPARATSAVGRQGSAASSLSGRIVGLRPSVAPCNNGPVRILGIETSCDDTAIAVVEDRTKVLANIVSSQTDLHRAYGGIVPELASRHHLQNIDAVRPDWRARSAGPIEPFDSRSLGLLADRRRPQRLFGFSHPEWGAGFY